MKNTEKILVLQLKDKGEAAVVCGATGSGKSSMFSETAKSKGVQRLLRIRESHGKGGTIPAIITITDCKDLDEEALYVSATLRPVKAETIGDDNELPINVLFNAVAKEKSGKDSANYDVLLHNELLAAINNQPNESVAYKLRNIGADDKADSLLVVLRAFDHDLINAVYQEACAADGAKVSEKKQAFGKLVKANAALNKQLVAFWNWVADYLNEQCAAFRNQLQEAGAIFGDGADADTFCIALKSPAPGGEIHDRFDNIVKKLLKSEDTAEEQFLDDLHLLYVGKPELFAEEHLDQLCVMVHNEADVHCIRLIDTQGILHDHTKKNDEEADRILTLIRGMKCSYAIMLINAEVTNTTKDGMSALTTILQKLAGNVTVYTIFTHIDKAISDYAVRLRTEKDLDGLDEPLTTEEERACYESVINDIQKTKTLLDAAIARNTAKHKPILAPFIFLAGRPTFGYNQMVDSLLSGNSVNYISALCGFLREFKHNLTANGYKFKVHDFDTTQIANFNFANDPSRDIASLYNNLVNDCKNKRLYASTARACVRWWRNYGSHHTSNVAENKNQYVNIETLFVDSARNYGKEFEQNICLSNLNQLLVSPDTDQQAFTDKLLEFACDGDNRLGRIFACITGDIAFANGYLKNSNEYLLQYERFEQMLEYTQYNFFPAKKTRATSTTKDALEQAMNRCVKEFIDSRCVVID